ncbi:MAG TPA: carboxypeptidase regulatory-like domain-containing protein [Candidatus Sulfotelmatobacter sp.]|nr:carboxypeptidase regulatory-like domain-containing protein [Candidatus Sulfotelmatobacter sp.]
MTISILNVRHNCQRILQTLAITVIILLPATLFAQGYFGTVSGLLSDTSGAVVAAAKVTLLDEEKGYRFTSTSDGSGRYIFASIPPGTYSVSAETKGFEKTVRTHIVLNVSENVTANLTLKVAAAAESVRVEAQNTSIATEDAVTGQVVDRRFINDLPLINRSVMNLTYLAPGVTDSDDQCSEVQGCTGTNFVINGSRPSGADVLLDGASATNFEPNGGITLVTYLPSPEAVEEYKLQQSNFSAEYGFSGASVVNMVTRSGTNRFHGSAYDFIRNTIGDANDWFNDRGGVPIPQVHRHNFGGTIGGPIFKNKTFFFFDYEGVRSSNPETHTAGVPSTLERAGDFGEICAANGGTFDSTGMCSATAGQLWDPYSVGPTSYSSADGGPVRNTFIPYNNIANYISPGSPNLPANLQPTPGVKGNLIDPVAQKVLNLFPTANNQAAGGIYNNWIASGVSRSPNDQFDVKIDHRFNDKDLLSGRYSQQWSSNVGFDCFKTLIDPCGHGPDKSTSHVFTLNDTYTFSPTLLLTATLGFTRGAFHRLAYSSSLGADPLGALGFPEYLKANGFNGVPALLISDYVGAGFANAGNDPYGNYKQGQDTGQLTVLLSKIHGAHELKFGFEGRLHQQNYIQTNAPLGYFQFSNVGSSLCSQPGITTACADAANASNSSGGDAMASFLMGQMLGPGGYYEIQFQPATQNYQYAWFAQDNWKITPKLTLNLGVRYDVSLPRTDKFNHQDWFNPNAVNPLNGGKISYTDPLTGQPVTRALLGGEVFATPSDRTNYVTDWSNIQPRIGFAYQFMQKMVVRGGYGIYYGQSRSGASGVVPWGSAGFDEYTNVITTFNSDRTTPYLHLSNPFPNGLNQPAGNSLGLLNDVGFAANGPLRIASANRSPQEQTWTLGIERQLPSNIVVSADYIGKKGTHLPFAGSSYYFDILGPWVEQYAGNTPQMNALTSNVANPFYPKIITNPNSSLAQPTVPGYQLELPYPQFTSVFTDDQLNANSIYHGLQLTAKKAFSNGLEFLVNYTWSKSIDDSSTSDDNVTWTGSFSSQQDPNKPWLERSLSTFDIPSVLKFSYSYNLPFGRGRAFLGNMPRALDAIVGGWRTNGIWQIASGRPLTLAVAGGGTPIPTYGAQRPNMIGRLRRNYRSRTDPSGHDWVDQFFADPNSAPTASNPVGDILNVPAPYTLGDSPRATADVRTPLLFACDMSLIKDFLLSNVHEGIHLELRLEAQNAFNHPTFSVASPNYGGYGTQGVGDPTFGMLTQMSPIGPRQGQLAVKISF